MGDLATRYEDSLGTKLHYTYGVSDIFGFDGSIGYSSHSNGRFTMATLLTGLRTNLAWYDKVIPYGTLGLGFFWPSYLINPTSREHALVFGIHLGAGVDLEITKQIFFGGALHFHDAFNTTKTVQSDGQSIVNGAELKDNQLEIGGTFTSITIRAGVSF